MKDTFIGIYKITSPSNKVYIGQSRNIKRRWKEYMSVNSRKYPKLNSSFIKHGKKSHKFEIIETFKEDVLQDILDKKEQFYMDFYKSKNHELLNLKEAGCYGKHSEETKKIIKEKRKKQVMLPRSEKFKKKMSEMRKGKNNPMYGKVVSKETREKLRKNNIGKHSNYVFSEEQLKAMSLAKKGKPWTKARREAYNKKYSKNESDT